MSGVGVGWRQTWELSRKENGVYTVESDGWIARLWYRYRYCISPPHHRFYPAYVSWYYCEHECGRTPFSFRNYSDDYKYPILHKESIQLPRTVCNNSCFHLLRHVWILDNGQSRDAPRYLGFLALHLPDRELHIDRCDKSTSNKNDGRHCELRDESTDEVSC